jgi:hypothetical protein
MSNTNLHTDYIDSNIGLTLIRMQRDTVLRRYYSVLSVCMNIFSYLPPSRDPRSIPFCCCFNNTRTKQPNLQQEGSENGWDS